MHTTESMPSPDLFFETMSAYQRTAALKAAIELDLFSAVGDGGSTAAEIARTIAASERGVRILSNYLTILGFMRKTGNRYHLTPDTAAFLTRRSPAYLGGTVEFLAAPAIVRNFDDLAQTVKRGFVDDSHNTVAPDHPVWVHFARAMRPMMQPAAEMIAGVLDVAASGPMKVLDLAAGHGAFGIAIARQNPQARIVAVDWPNVLAVARQNAAEAGVSDRHESLPGDAFTVDYGSGFDLALVTNFLHHFDAETNVVLLRKIAAALKPGGRVAVLEFVPNEDEVSPPVPAAFAMQMLGGTASGDAYPFTRLQYMLQEAGFASVVQHPLTPMPQTLVLGVR